MFTLASSLALTGCLALDKVELPEIPDYPPSVVDAYDTLYPSSGVIELDVSGTEPLDEFLDLSVIIRDPNIAQELSYRVFVDGTPGEPRMRVSETVGHTRPVMQIDRPVVVRVPIVHLTQGTCHRIELIVSGGFAADGVDLRAPELQNDFASLVWWVRTDDGINIDIDLQACPTSLTPVHQDPS